MLAQQPKQITEIEGITEYELANGVQVLLFPDDSKPEVTVNMTVLVGSRHEGYGETGMAHLLEHMLFKGTSTHPDIPELLKDRGVLNMNGTTWLDRTNYYETLPAGDENLKFAIRMEADRLVNSLIRGEDLQKEMTVVRNEFEIGENSPQRILMQRIMATAFEWHNYGKSTIGNRSDIERVPIENLRRFYRKFYQPDNIMVVVAGQFDKDDALQYLNEHFGSLEIPQRELPNTYTEEPAQDGERRVVLRRVGDTQLVGVGYHIPSASHPDYAATQVLVTLLGMEPSGPLYKALVKSKLASTVMAMDIAGHDPGMLLAMAEVPLDGDLDRAQQIMLAEIEKTGTEGVSTEDVSRAKQRIKTRREREFANTSQFAIGLSEWRAYGDWRLYFLHRDRVESVTAQDVQRVASQYLVPSNRTVGLFIPTEKPVRAPVPSVSNLDKVLAGYKGRAKMAVGESFEPTPSNIEARTTKGEFPGGIRYALLPKKTRGERVFLTVRLHYGNENSLQGKVMASEVMPLLLSRGTTEMSFEQFRDRLDQLNANLSFSGDVGNLTASIQTKRENLLDVIELMKLAMRTPALDPQELDVIKLEMATQYENFKSNPTGLAMITLQRKLSPYDSDDVRYVPTIDESIKRINSLKIDQIQELHRQFLNGQNGEVAVVGDFDSNAVVQALGAVFADWETSEPFQRIASPALPIRAERIDIKTPDKKNAVFFAGSTFPMRDDNPDYESLLIGNYILGGGPLSSRLADRVRKEEGLSYGVGSMFNAHAIDPAGMFMIRAASAPQNTEQVVDTVNEELARLLESGVTEDELQKAKDSYLQNRRGGRAQDARLVATLINNLRTNRNMEFQQASDEKIESLTKQQVDQAMKQYFQPDKLIIVTAGDFDSVEGDEPDGVR